MNSPTALESRLATSEIATQSQPRFPFRRTEIIRLIDDPTSVAEEMAERYGPTHLAVFGKWHGTNGHPMNEQADQMFALMEQHGIDSEAAMAMINAGIDDQAVQGEIVSKVGDVRHATMSAVAKGVNRLEPLKKSGIMEKGPVAMGGGPRSVAQYLDRETAKRQFADTHPSMASEVVRRDFVDQLSDGDESAQNELLRRVRTTFDLYTEVISHSGITRIPREAVQDMLEVCIGVTCRSDYSVIITVGYGGSDDPALLRTPSYVIPGLEMLEIFKKYHTKGSIQSMPTLRIIQATKLAHLVNTTLDPELVDRYAQDRDRAVKLFVQHFADTTDGDAPIHLSDHIIFETDGKIDYPSMDEAAAIFERATLDEHHSAFFEAQMMGRADKRVDGDEAYKRRAAQRYIAAHTDIFLDGLHPERNGVPHKPDAAISLGSQGGEVPFNHFRAALSEVIPAKYKPTSLRLGQRIGDHPPYYRQTERDNAPVPQDVTMREFDTSPLTTFDKASGPKQKAVTHDLKAQWAFILERCRRRGLDEDQARAAYEAYCRACA